MRIFTVLKSGGKYTRDHAERLGEQVEKHSGYPLDVMDDFDFLHNYPGWWAKLELFRLACTVLYFDLDTTIVDDITPLIEEAQKHEFMILRDFNIKNNMQSAVMSWNGDMVHLYRKFAENADRYIEQWRGDQEWIQDHYAGEVTYIQDVLPNKVQSYKVHLRRGHMHPDCRVVCFHGRPKPWDIAEITKE